MGTRALANTASEEGHYGNTARGREVLVDELTNTAGKWSKVAFIVVVVVVLTSKKSKMS
ncbi:uncharacterized protein G2W53_029423 [Senna tora]|uniref:Uncharacterized protein n=1 Tax=Senna tora TaxID=362788 RepID=A0A834T493_9FABA|nr:uncharacterized protein G2W53_029423 [Senna tora]